MGEYRGREHAVRGEHREGAHGVGRITGERAAGVAQGKGHVE